MNQKILMVSSVPFWPLDEGNKTRIYHLINNLKKCGYVIDYMFYDENGSNDIVKMQELIGKDHFIHLIKQEKSRRENYRDRFWRFADIPKSKLESYILTDGFFTKELGRGVKEAAAAKQYDIVWFEYYFYSKALDLISDKCFKVIDTHDVFAYRDKKSPKRMRTKYSESLTYLGERKVLRRADLVLAIQEQEETYFSRLLKGTNTKTLTIGDFTCGNHEEGALVQNRDFCFIGSDNEINVSSVTWFIKEVYPLVKERMPDARLILAGRICQKIDCPDEVIKKGVVEDLAAIYHNVRVVINPSLMGTGLNIKAVEAISYKKPMVCTSSGSRGFSLDEKLFEVADAPRTFAQTLVELLADDSRCMQLINNCRRFEEKYRSDNLKRLKMIGELYSEKRRG